MTTIRTVHNNIVNLELELGESAIVQFQPAGANAVPCSKIISFTVGTLSLSNGRMALSISFPEDHTYWHVDATARDGLPELILLDDENRPARMTFVLASEKTLEIERFSSRSLTSGFFHKG